MSNYSSRIRYRRDSFLGSLDRLHPENRIRNAQPKTNVIRVRPGGSYHLLVPDVPIVENTEDHRYKATRRHRVTIFALAIGFRSPPHSRTQLVRLFHHVHDVRPTYTVGAFNCWPGTFLAGDRRFVGRRTPPRYSSMTAPSHFGPMDACLE